MNESCASPAPDPTAPAPGVATILLVEDEQTLREITAAILSSYGFEILTASSGPEAIEIWNGNKDRISLLLTDVIMPRGLTGIDIAERFRSEKPSLKIIYTSGYQLDTIPKSKTIQRSGQFLPKPYIPSALAKLISETLGSAEPIPPR